jgi:hypothetical protein
MPTSLVSYAHHVSKPTEFFVTNDIDQTFLVSLDKQPKWGPRAEAQRFNHTDARKATFELRNAHGLVDVSLVFAL